MSSFPGQDFDGIQTQVSVYFPVYHLFTISCAVISAIPLEYHVFFWPGL